MTEDILRLKAKMQSDDWMEIRTAGSALVKIGGDDVCYFLIDLLKCKNQLHRNGAALALEKLGDSRAVEALFEAIFKHPNRNGTMVYALTALNCKDHLVDLYKILFREAYEAKMSVFQILEEQTFTFTDEDLLQIRKMWVFYNSYPEKGREFEVPKVKKDMETCVGWYVSYLEE